MRRGLDRGVLYILLAIIYTAIAVLLINRADWNPNTPNYEQYLVGVSGAYTDGDLFNNRYLLLSVDGNVGYLVLARPNGEVEKIYQVSPVPAGVLVKDNAAYLVFVEGNTIEIVRYDGEFSRVATVSTRWTFRPVAPPRIVKGGSLAVFGERKDLDLRAVVSISLEENISNPKIVGRFCKRCKMQARYALPDGEVFGNEGSTLFVAIPKNGDVAFYTFRTTPPAMVTDICGDLLVGYTKGAKLWWASEGNGVAYETNLPVTATPVCIGKKAYLAGGSEFTIVDLQELNKPVVFSSASGFEPVGRFTDVPYEIVMGADGGNPSYIRNIAGEIKCPESVYPVEENISVEKTPISRATLTLLKTTIFKYPGKPFADIREVSVDEDFRCYST